MQARQQQGVQAVAGHPWCKALRSVAEQWWGIPPAGVSEEHFVFLMIGGHNCVGSIGTECSKLQAIVQQPVSGPAFVCDAQGRIAHRVCEPLHPSPKGIGAAWGRSFARRVLRLIPGNPAFLVPSGNVTKGDMTMSAWSRDGVLYSIAVARAISVATATKGRVAGVIWVSGEADACDRDTAEAYGDKLKELVANLRTDIGDPKLPIVLGELPPFLGESSTAIHFPLPGKAVHGQIINEAIRKIAKEDEWTVCSQSPRGHEADRLHFDGGAMEEFGNRFADDWHTVWSKNRDDDQREGLKGEPLTKAQWMKNYGKLINPGGTPWAAAPTYNPNKAKDQPAGAADGSLRAGDRVQAFGLQGAKELNGLSGTVVGRAQGGRYTVKFDGGKGEKALKSANLAPVKINEDEWMETGKTPDGKFRRICCWDMQGAKCYDWYCSDAHNRPGQTAASQAVPNAPCSHVQQNCNTHRAINAIAQRARKAEADAKKKARETGGGRAPALQAPATGAILTVGSVVTAHSLVGAKELNGLTGKVTQMSPDGRWEVLFPGRGVKALKGENLRAQHNYSAQQQTEQQESSAKVKQLQDIAEAKRREAAEAAAQLAALEAGAKKRGADAGGGGAAKAARTEREESP